MVVAAVVTVVLTAAVVVTSISRHFAYQLLMWEAPISGAGSFSGGGCGGRWGAPPAAVADEGSPIQF